MGIYTLCKAERLNSKILIGKMFEGGVSKSFSIFPIRVVYMPVEQGEAPASILISVSKRRFKRAVKRNRATCIGKPFCVLRCSLAAFAHGQMPCRRNFGAIATTVSACFIGQCRRVVRASGHRPSHTSGLSFRVSWRSWNCRMLFPPTVPSA